MFIPIGDDNSRVRTFPVVTYLLIGANVAMWLLQLRGDEAFTGGLSFVPDEITSGRDLVGTTSVFLNDRSIAIPQYVGPSPIWLTIFTAMFMHGSWMHIIGNMLYLHIFGDQIEDDLGHLKFLMFYLVAGVAASLAQVAVDPHSTIPCLGASGAVAGVLGAYLLRYPYNRVRVLIVRQVADVSAVMVIGFWILLQFLGQMGSAVGTSDGVAYMAHIGGFAGGIVMLFLLGRRSPRAS